MDRKEQNVDVGIELADNVVITRRMWPEGMRSADDIVRNLTGRYNEMPYLPDNTLLVLRCPLSDSILKSDYLDISSARKSIPDRPDATVFHDIPLRLAAYCISRKLQLSPEHMEALKASPGYAAFHADEEEKQWHHQEMLLADRPHECRDDDWSFVFGTTEREFSTRERQDILTLGLLMSTGIDREFYTPVRVPSHHLLKPYFDRLDFLTCGNPPSGEKDIAGALRAIRAAAGRILADKYPEVAPLMHERCGLPPEVPGSEIYALVKDSGEAVDVSRNLRGGSGFYDYLVWQVYSQKDRAGEFAGDCTFYRYRSDDPTLMPPAGLTEQQMWERLRKTAGERGIEPLDHIRFVDALYCLQNGRNPMHPDNCRQKLLDESLYREVCGLFSEARTGKEEELHIETDVSDAPGTKLKM